MGGVAKRDDNRAQRRQCRRCGTELHGGRENRFCQSCARRRGSRTPLLETVFFIREPVRSALAGYDFGYVFRAVRRATGLTQQELGDLLDLDQDRISRIERGERRLRDIVVVARISSRLGIPPELLGFISAAASVGTTETGDTEVNWVKRRDFPQLVAAIVLGVSGALDLERLAALLPTDPAESTARRIGTADVEAIEHTTAVLRQWDFSSGGGMARSAAVAQLRSVLPLLGMASTPAVRERLLVATADLGMTAAWSTYDVEQHNQARRLWTIALSVAREADHPSAADLTADLLMDMANQAMHLRRPREALSLVQLGYGAGASRSQPLSAPAATRLKSYEAWFHAAQGDARASEYARGQAVEHFGQLDWATAPITAQEATALQGHSSYTLALTTNNAKHAARAIPWLSDAVDGYAASFARSRAVNLPGLAGAYALTGDRDAAVHIGGQAVEEISGLASPRIHDRLRTLDTVLRPYRTDPAVGELRGRIQAVVAAA